MVSFGCIRQGCPRTMDVDVFNADGPVSQLVIEDANGVFTCLVCGAIIGTLPLPPVPLSAPPRTTG